MEKTWSNAEASLQRNNWESLVLDPHRFGSRFPRQMNNKWNGFEHKWELVFHICECYEIPLMNSD